MKVTLAIVSSLNGAITRGSRGDMSWISDEDNELFTKLRREHEVILMGGNTYRSIRASLRPFARLRLIMTRNPAEFKDDEVKGRFEFSNESPKALIKRLENESYKSVIIVGGTVSNLFLKAGLVDEIHWTIEPYYFGLGHSLTTGIEFTQRLKLIDSQKLNDQGTLYLRYKVAK